MCLWSAGELVKFIGHRDALTFISLSLSHADTAHFSDLESNGMAEQPTTPMSHVTTEPDPWISILSS